MYSSWETLGAQVLAAVLVVGSYWLANEIRVRRPQRLARESADPITA